MLKKLIKLSYALGLRKPCTEIDRLHYLKRLMRPKHDLDQWYFSDKDASQFSPNKDLLVRSSYRDKHFLFHCSLSSHVESSIIRNGLYGRHVLDLMWEHTAPGSMVVDVGANIGAYTVPLARVCPECMLHAFEPNPFALKRLGRNLALNSLSNVVTYGVGLSERCGTLNFSAHDGRNGDLGLSSFLESAASRSGHTRTMPVEVKTLDSLFDSSSPPISVIKIDVQGGELQVLAGAVQTILRHHPVILIEHEDINFASSDQAAEAKERLAALFQELDYDVYYVTRQDPSLLFPVLWSNALNGDLIAFPPPP